jgi:outer membrane protein TolC
MNEIIRANDNDVEIETLSMGRVGGLLGPLAARVSAIVITILQTGCVSDKPTASDEIVAYQEQITARGPQDRIDTEGINDERPLGIISPLSDIEPEQLELPGKKQIAAAFTTGVVSDEFPLSVSFTDNSKGASAPITSWNWDFGDSPDGESRVDTNQNPSHRYDKAGIYNVSLTVTSQFGEDTTTRAVIVPVDFSNGLLELQSFPLTVEQAINRALRSSPQITSASFDPAIAEQEIIQEAAEFEPVFFAESNREVANRPSNSSFEPGDSDEFKNEVGFRQRTPLGSELSASFALTRSWDDLTIREIQTRYEPIGIFQIRQPLLRGAWGRVNRAGVDVAKLNHEIALQGFRQTAEDIATQVIEAYWSLYEARQVLVIQRDLYTRTDETLERLYSRMEIDVTSAQVKQAQASLFERESAVLLAEKLVLDSQNSLQRLMADPELNLVGKMEIIAVTPPTVNPPVYDITSVLAAAMTQNPTIKQREIALEIADINLDVADHEKLPRLDLVSSLQTQALEKDSYDALDEFTTGDFSTYSVGLIFEMPVGGNRARKAEKLKRKYERSKAISDLQASSDQIANEVHVALRAVETNYEVMDVEREAIDAAREHLSTLDAAEAIMDRLTPEFLLVKLQAQEALAQAQRREVSAIVDYVVSLVRLSNATGTVLRASPIDNALPTTALTQ